MIVCGSCKNCVGLGKDSKGNLISRRCNCPELPFEGPIMPGCRFYSPRNVQNVPPQNEEAHTETPPAGNVSQEKRPQVQNRPAPEMRPQAQNRPAPEMRPQVQNRPAPEMRPQMQNNPAPAKKQTAPQQKPKKKKTGAIVAIILVVLLLIVGVAALGVGGFFVYNIFFKDKNPDVNIGEVATEDTSENGDFFVYEYDHSKNEGKTGYFFQIERSYEDKAVVTPDVGLNLRLAPNEEAMRIRIMECMDEVYVIAFLNEWAFVRHNDDYGWCSAEFLDMTDTKVSTPERVSSDLLYTTEEITPVRVAVGDNAPVVHFLPRGMGVTVLNRQDGWSYILVNEISGWCMTDMLSEEKSPESSALVNDQAVISGTGSASVYAESGTSSDVVFTIEAGASVHVLIKKGEYVYIDSLGNRGWIHRDFLAYELDMVKPLYCEQNYIDEIQAAIDASKEIANAFVGKKVRGRTEMTEADVVDFHIDASNLYFDVYSHASPYFFEEQVYYVNDYCMVRDSRFETIADAYEMFYSYFTDEMADNLCSVIFEYNGAIYADMLDIGGCTYPYDDYEYTVTISEDCFDIGITYDGIYGTLSGSSSVIYEDGIWVSADTPPILPP